MNQLLRFCKFKYEVGIDKSAETRSDEKIPTLA